MGFGLFNSESTQKTYVTTNTITDSQNRTTNKVMNLSEAGNTTITIPSQAPSLGGGVAASSMVLPALAGVMVVLVGALLLRR